MAAKPISSTPTFLLRPVNWRLLVFSLSLVVQFAAGQPAIRFLNSSFEFDKQNAASQQPMYWYNFGADGESPSDLQPGFFNCEARPHDGHTCVGMVVRDNGTSEAIGQRLDRPLREGQAYRCSAFMARSARYKSVSRLTGEVVDFFAPVKLRVLGCADGDLKNLRLLSESPVVNWTEWKEVYFDLKPAGFDCNWLVFQAFWIEAGNGYYNGNLLLDAISPIVELGGDGSTASTSATEAPPEPLDASDDTRPIELANPSFEKFDADLLEFTGWEFVARPDPIPERCAKWAGAADGKLFLVLTTSGKERCAKTMARLSRPMRNGRAYRLTLLARHCEPKAKKKRLLGLSIEFEDTQGCFVQVLGVSEAGNGLELLATIGPVTNGDWREFELDMAPKMGDVRAIILQAWNDGSKVGGRTRHVFIDNLSAIVPVK